MHLKLIYLFLGLYILKISATDTEDDITDFDFDSEVTNQTSNPLNDTENDVDHEEETDTKPLLSSKEEYVRKIIINSMKNQEMKHKVARVLPILRVMTPEQKLALATLVTRQVLAPPTSRGLSLDEVSYLFGNNPNTTAELMLPISLDIANMFRKGKSEKGPTAEELRQPYRPNDGLFRRNIIDNRHKYYVQNPNMKPNRPRKSNKVPRKPANNTDLQNCELFTNNICLKASDYPIDAIMASIRRNKQAMIALLADYKAIDTDASIDGIAEDQENQINLETDTNEIRRNGAEAGFMCPSQIRYARPQKARSTNGQWKFIVNTVEHTQTLRLERCMKPGDSCTYLNDNFKSRCMQVYNYHRLLSWDPTSGLHMDIYKVPTCCSCHIDSYKVTFPPHHQSPPTTEEHFPGDEIEQETGHVTQESEHLQNAIPNTKPSTPYRQEFPQIYTLETNNRRPPLTNSELPKYLEAPKPQSPFGKLTFNQHFKRSNTPKPIPLNKRPQRPLRRRIPLKNIRDLAQSESNIGQNIVQPPVTSNYVPETSTHSTKNLSKRVNYNYHPIIDFFEPDKIESRVDDFEIELGDSDWRPVTPINFVTDKTRFKN